MLKEKVIATIGLAVMVCCLFASCSKEETSTTTPKVSFAKDIKPIITTKCTPCHGSAGQLAKYEVYATSKAGVSKILERIQLNPTDKGFMPAGGAKLSTAEIDLIKKWQSDGLAE